MRAALNRSAIAAGCSLLAHAALVLLWLRHDSVTEPLKATVVAPAMTHGSTVKVSIYGSRQQPAEPSKETQVRPHLPTSPGAAARESEANRLAAQLAQVPIEQNQGSAGTPVAPPISDLSGIPGAAGPSVAEPLPVGSAAIAASDIPEDIKRALHDQLQASATQCYPAAAKRFGSKGTATVSFCVQALKAEKISLQQSSGSSLLDDAAQHCVMSDIDNFLGMVPVSLEGHCFTFPVAFGAQ